MNGARKTVLSKIINIIRLKQKINIKVKLILPVGKRIFRLLG